MKEKETAIIRINRESKDLFDSIAKKNNKKTIGLFQEMCHHYNNTFEEENNKEAQNLNTETVLRKLRKQIIETLASIDKIMIHDLINAEKKDAPSSKIIEDKNQIKEILLAFLPLIKTNHSKDKAANTKEISQKDLLKLKKFIDEI